MADHDGRSPIVPPPTSDDPSAAPDPLQVAAWRLVLDLEPDTTLPDLAAHALARGIDSPSLRQLAGLREDDVWEIDRLWADTVEELGIATPQATAARRLLIEAVARDIVAGRIRPLWGAADIVELIDFERVGPQSLDVIQGLFYQDQETPDDRPAIERQIREAAADLLRR